MRRCRPLAKATTASRSDYEVTSLKQPLTGCTSCIIKDRYVRHGSRHRYQLQCKQTAPETWYSLAMALVSWRPPRTKLASRVHPCWQVERSYFAYILADGGTADCTMIHRQSSFRRSHSSRENTFVVDWYFVYCGTHSSFSARP